MAKAKVIVKAPAKKAAKKTTAKANPKKPATIISIEKVCADALKKLQALDIEHQLQSNLAWCLGSFRNDKNPSGLYEMAEQVLTVYKTEKVKKNKGVTAKAILDIEQALSSR